MLVILIVKCRHQVYLVVFIGWCCSSPVVCCKSCVYCARRVKSTAHFATTLFQILEHVVESLPEAN